LRTNVGVGGIAIKKIGILDRAQESSSVTIAVGIGYCTNVFTESLLSSGSICVYIYILLYYHILKLLTLFNIQNVGNSYYSYSLQIELAVYYVKTGIVLCRNGGESLQIEAGSHQRRDY
jgi:hypothetical protein